MGIAVSSSHIVSTTPSSSGGGLLTLFSFSNMRSLSWETVVQKLFSVGPSHGLQLSTNSPSVVPSHGMQSFRNRLLQCGSLTGSQVLPANLLRRGLLCPQVHRSWQEPASAWAPHRVKVSFGHPSALAWGPFHGLQVDIYSTRDLRGLQGDNLPHHGLSSQAARENFLLWHLKHILPSPSSLTLVSAELFLSHPLSPLSRLPFFSLQFFSPSLICYDRGTTTIADWLGLGQRRVCLRASWH